MTAANESTTVTRVRRFDVATYEEAAEILAQMKRERCQGELRFVLSCGGTPVSAVMEERSKIPVVDIRP